MKADPRIDAYIAQSGEFARPILRHFRALVRRACPEVEETIKWNMPFFLHRGILCTMAAFKAHCVIGYWHQGMDKVIGVDGAKADEAMGRFGRVTGLEDLPDDRTMLRYLREAVKLNESGAPARPAAKPRPAPPVPKDLAAALKKNRAAAATFGKFSPSHKREYIEWITGAKRDETRHKRLAATLAQLSAGKSRHWKYQQR